MFAFTATAQEFESDNLTTRSGQKLQIVFIKHASLMMEFGGHVIYVDPISGYADYSKMPKADIILITHEHHDHLDLKAIAEIEKAGTIIVANPASAKILGKGKVMANGDVMQPAAWIGLEAVPAYNTTEGRDKYHPKGRDNGYVVTLGDTRIYIAGDTENIPEMADLKNIDIAFLPVNQPYTMTVEQAAAAARTIIPKILYPYHYGETEIGSLVRLLKSEPQIEVRIRQMQ